MLEYTILDTLDVYGNCDKRDYWERINAEKNIGRLNLAKSLSCLLGEKEMRATHVYIGKLR